MTTSPTMKSLVQEYLEERRSAGFAWKFQAGS
jgi:hypothetical protein